MTGYLFEDGEKKTCSCGCPVFHITTGLRRRNLKETNERKEWEEQKRSFTTCAQCGTRKEAIVFDWRKTWVTY